MFSCITISNFPASCYSVLSWESNRYVSVDKLSGNLLAPPPTSQPPQQTMENQFTFYWKTATLSKTIGVQAGHMTKKQTCVLQTRSTGMFVVYDATNKVFTATGKTIEEAAEFDFVNMLVPGHEIAVTGFTYNQKTVGFSSESSLVCLQGTTPDSLFTPLYESGAIDLFMIPSWGVSADLYLPNFDGAQPVLPDLSYMDFSQVAGCDLTGVDFTKWKLSGNNFSSAKLAGANFQGIDLVGIGCVFSSPLQDPTSNESPINFSGATLTYDWLGQYWNSLIMDQFTTIQALPKSLSSPSQPLNARHSFLQGLTIDNHTMESADFSYTALSGTRFKNVDLSNAKFDGAVLSKTSDLTPTIFDHANLQSCSFGDGTHLGGVDFTGLNMTGATFEKCFLEATKFVDACLTGATFEDISDAQGASFIKACLVNSKWSNVLFTNYGNKERVAFDDAFLQGADFEYNGLPCDMDSATLENAYLAGEGGTVKITPPDGGWPTSPTYVATNLPEIITSKNTTCPSGAQGPCSQSTWPSTCPSEWPTDTLANK